MRIFFADSETAGLFGDLRIMGVMEWLGPQTFGAVELIHNKFREKLDRYLAIEGQIYFHNLEFDLSKILRKLGPQYEIEWSTALVINREVRRCQLRQKRDGRWYTLPLLFADTLGLFAGESLANLTKSFGLDEKTGKIDLADAIKQGGYQDAEDYFSRVPLGDKLFRRYLTQDIVALATVWETVFGFSGLTLEEFAKCPTMASLSMRYFRKNFKQSYDVITKSGKTWAGTSIQEADGIMRQFYLAARTNVFRPTSGRAYHYDVNGLYNYVMGKYRYPVGGVTYSDDESVCWEVLKRVQEGRITHAFICADISYPLDTFLPVLPVRLDGRLLFPVGKFHGFFTGAELELAIRQHNVTVNKIHHVVFWLHTADLFSEFVDIIAFEKAHSFGARRSFFKGIGNANYGKYGMKLLREDIISAETLKDLRASGENPDVKTWYMGNDTANAYYLTDKWIYAPYVHLGIAAHITAYARMELWNLLHYAETYCGGVYYCDTDSVVCAKPLPSRFVDDKSPGKVKLERIVEEGLYLQPKLYAEKVEGQEPVLKSKGLIKEWRTDATYEHYQAMYDAMRRNEEGRMLLYESVPQRTKIITSLDRYGEIDKPTVVRKSIALRNPSPHRDMLWDENLTRPRVLDMDCPSTV